MHHDIVSWSYIKDMDVITKIYAGNASGNEMFRLANKILATSYSDKPKDLLVKYESEVHDVGGGNGPTA